MKTIATLFIIILNVSCQAQIDISDTNTISDESASSMNIDELIKIKKKAKEKSQYLLLLDFNQEYGKDAEIEALEFDNYYELTVTHPNKDGYTGGAECYRLDKETRKHTMLWHEHPVEIPIEEGSKVKELKK